MNYHDNRARNGMAYGVDPTRPEFYSLRQSRYDSLAFDIAQLAGEFEEKGQRMALLDIGPWDGVTTRHLEPHPQATNVDYSVADLKLHPRLHKPEGYSEIFLGDLMEGYPQIESDRYDVVVCEQVLEHLTELETPIKTLARVLKPGGTLFVGVPIFPNGIHLVREYGLPIWDRVFPPNKVRGHVQSFSKRKITRLISRLTNLELKEARGYRIVSGGFLKPLEEKEWWWRFNRALGRAVPGLCVEIQLVYTKPPTNQG